MGIDGTERSGSEEGAEKDPEISEYGRLRQCQPGSVGRFHTFLIAYAVEKKYN